MYLYLCICNVFFYFFVVFVHLLLCICNVFVMYLTGCNACPVSDSGSDSHCRARFILSDPTHRQTRTPFRLRSWTGQTRTILLRANQSTGLQSTDSTWSMTSSHTRSHSCVFQVRFFKTRQHTQTLSPSNTNADEVVSQYEEIF